MGTWGGVEGVMVGFLLPPTDSSELVRPVTTAMSSKRRPKACSRSIATRSERGGTCRTRPALRLCSEAGALMTKTARQVVALASFRARVSPHGTASGRGAVALACHHQLTFAEVLLAVLSLVPDFPSRLSGNNGDLCRVQHRRRSAVGKPSIAAALISGVGIAAERFRAPMPPAGPRV